MTLSVSLNFILKLLRHCFQALLLSFSGDALRQENTKNFQVKYTELIISRNVAVRNCECRIDC